MSRSVLARVGGIAAVLGGVSYALINALRLAFASVEEPSSQAIVAFAAFSLLLFPLLGLVSALCFAMGLTGLYALLGRRSKLGISGLVLAYLSVLAFVFSIGLSIYISYQAAVNPGTGFMPPEGVSPQLVVGVAQVLLLGGGVLLVGVATFGAQVLGRWRVLPLILGALTVVVALFPMLRMYFDWPLDPGHQVVLILQGLCWILLGSVLWAYASREEARAARSTT